MDGRGDPREAWDIADRHHLHKPVVEQPQYNLFGRDAVEKELRRPLYDGIGLGLTTWSPARLRSPLGQVPRRRPGGSRARSPGVWLARPTCSPTRSATGRARELTTVAKELDCTLAQLSIAWCARNPHVSSVITGASRVEQVHENLGALEVVPRLSDEVMSRIAAIARSSRSRASRPAGDGSGLG